MSYNGKSCIASTYQRNYFTFSNSRVDIKSFNEAAGEAWYRVERAVAAWVDRVVAEPEH
jgi:hypothetical protein